MYRPALRSAAGSSLSRALPRPAATRRFLTTAPPHKTSRSWKNSAARWGAAGAILYYYNTAAVFADEPQYVAHAPPETSRETETYPTIDTLAEQRRAQARSQAQSAPSGTASVGAPEAAAGAAPGGPDDLEEEASQQGAFNEETGEINWDCPCLGGMAHGPCGEQFRTAFSCFVFSKEEPKGVDCIEHFKAMQDCFRDHPDIYGAELDDVDADEMPPAEGEAVSATPRDAAATAPHDGGEKVSKGYGDTGPDAQARTERAVAAGQQVKEQHGARESVNESEAAVPKNWHDTTDANTSK